MYCSRSDRGKRPELDEDLAELVVPLSLLPVDGCLELVVRDAAASDQDVAQPVATVHDRRVDDLPLSK